MNSDLDSLVLVNNARRALDRGRFELIYQPIYSVNQREVATVETLLRWRMRPGHLTAAQDFSAIFGDRRMALSIRDFVLATTLRQVARWHADGHVVPRISVNTTAYDLCSTDFAFNLAAMVADFGLKPQMLEIEVAENALHGPERGQVALALEGLHYAGFSLALDNFGADHAALKALCHHPFSRLKIDRQLIRNALRSKIDRAIVRSVISLGHDLGLTVTASGVESEAHMEAAVRLGFDSVQGFFVCRPKEADLVPRVCHVLNLQGQAG
ncbi:EAL domain-containing protein [Rhizobium sp. G187]|uniref:EAL domain-containing protein n=1 Tax=unclassified Rhizobium TaxID=2613769 RepID=UPI0006B9D48C|nr:EAL domain-containing protein [Rhizobium sp. AAP43]KPF46927.1 diguanylate phosphodiesterase [Rhizobium sp. AAP43]